MPVYEYRCSSCGNKFSKLSRRILDADAPAPGCPACGGQSQRALSAFAYHRSLQMQLEQLDPRIERELDAVDNVKDDPLTRMNLNYPAAGPD